jgi:hypothetical protein
MLFEPFNRRELLTLLAARQHGRSRRAQQAAVPVIGCVRSETFDERRSVPPTGSRHRHARPRRSRPKQQQQRCRSSSSVSEANEAHAVMIDLTT